MIDLVSFPPALRTALITIDALAQSGVTHIAISPGSRSTPLTLAADAHPAVETSLHLDERSAAFFALGYGLTTNRPAALICTSGTAGANYYPAVIEAGMSQVPLLVLTTDRPPELHHSGANQTIDQIKLYGDHVRWAVDMPLPEADPPHTAVRNIAATAARAVARTLAPVPGPVHLNFPFRKPLEPTDNAAWQTLTAALETGRIAPTTPTMRTAVRLPGRDLVETLTDLINRHERGLIVCGPRCPGGDFPTAVARLAHTAGYPIAADPLSGVRFGPHTAVAPLLTGYETGFMRGRRPDWEPPEIIIRFGAVPTGKWLNQYLAAVPAQRRIHVRASGIWADDGHLTTDFWTADETGLCQLTQSLIARRPGGWVQQVQAWDAAQWAHMADHFPADLTDFGAITAVLDTLPAEANIIMGNSLPIRHLDQFARPRTHHWRVFANRGASGIDGNISTALGVAAAQPQVPAVLFIGDVTFYHDMNGLLAVRQNGIDNLTIVLLNNGGGGIFNRLPIAEIEPPFGRLFTTPHHLDFAHTADLYGLSHRRIQTAGQLVQLVGDGFPAAVDLVEIVTDSHTDESHRRSILPG